MMNIAGTQPIEDPAYRYQMPRLATKIEGRGNGIKTVVVNMNELAQALHRDAAEITKFFGCELGAQTSWNAETLKSVVNGAHQAADMQTQLSRYIEGFVLCSLCRLPETQYKVKSDIVYQVCGACGAKEPVDMGHRLTTFIANAYKKAKKERASAEKKSKKDGKDKKDSKDKKSKKSSKTKKKKSSDDDEAKENGADLADHHAESKESVDDDEADGNESQEDYDDVETDDRSAIDGAVERFAAFLAENPGSSISEKCDELATLQTFSALRVADRVLIFIGAVFDANAVTSGAVHTHKDMLAALAQDEPRQLIAAMEWFCGVRHPDLQRWFPALLKHLYDEDLVEEDVIFAWDAEGIENMYSSPSIDVEKLVEVRAEAAPFLKWLREAEVDDDDDDEDEEEDDDDA